MATVPKRLPFKGVKGPDQLITNKLCEEIFYIVFITGIFSQFHILGGEGGMGGREEGRAPYSGLYWKAPPN